MTPAGKLIHELERIEANCGPTVAGVDTVARSARDRFKGSITWRDGLDPPSRSVPTRLDQDPWRVGASPLDSLTGKRAKESKLSSIVLRTAQSQGVRRHYLAASDRGKHGSLPTTVGRSGTEVRRD